MAKRIVLIMAGSISFVLGILALLVPVLPTSPFIIIAAACFLKSSRRLYEKVAGMPYFGSHVRAFIRYKAVSVSARTGFLIFFWAAILASAIFITDNLILRLILAVFAISVTWYMFSLNVLTDEMKRELQSMSLAEEGIINES